MEGLAADPVVALAINLRPGAPELQITGPEGRGVEVLYRSSFDHGSAWHVLSYVVLTQAPGILADPLPGDPARFYQLATDPTSPLNGLAWIPAGTFLMGSPTSEEGRDSDEGPQRKITLTSGFWAGRREVTRAEYLAVTGSDPSLVPGDANRPVEQVTWNEARLYCQKLTAIKRNANQIPVGFAFRLPTEAEWEYAARSGSTNRFSFGDDSGYVQLGGYAWYVDNSGGIAQPVGAKKPNGWGLFDTSGNVWEWCQDWYAGYPAANQTNPKGPIAGVERVARGGSFYYDAWLTRCAARISYPPNSRNQQVGLRVVLAPE